MFNGFLQLPWWGYIVVTLVLTHITITTVTVFLHRCQAHRALTLHPVISHFFRFWLWLTTGMETRAWVSVHRKHHAKCETEEDPHSPQTRGIKTVLLQGAELYKQESIKPQTIEEYGHATPNDWLERHVYTQYTFAGISLMLIVNFLLFGFIGITIWAAQMIWIPLFAAGIINGAGHYWGYRNFETGDASTNLGNIGILIGGEELHNNHHAFPASAKFSSRFWEFDIGWLYIQILSFLGLARVKKIAPKPVVEPGKVSVDMDTLQAVIGSRLHVMSQYARNVTLPVFHMELRRADVSYRIALKKLKKALIHDESRVDAKSLAGLTAALKEYESLQTVYEYRRSLQELWTRTHSSQEKLLQALIDWCQRAEETGVEVLREFAMRLRGYSLEPARF